jgi:DNA-binding transcriptional ArsR family regulator
MLSSPAVSDDDLDAVFHALADRTRRALVNRLAEGPAKITDLARPFSMSLPAVSKHLRVLEQAHLVRRSIDGRIHHCSLGPKPLKDADGWLERYRAYWEGSLDSLASYLERE